MFFAKECREEPYGGLMADEVVDFVCHQDGRLEKPELCPEPLFSQVLTKCWLRNRKERPTFHQLLLSLSDYVQYSEK